MPRPTRSSDSSISSACCFVSAKIHSCKLIEPGEAGQASMPRYRMTGANISAQSNLRKPAGRLKRRPLQLQGFRPCSGPVNRAGLRDQAQFCRVREIQFEAPAVFCIERKIDVVAQVRFERALRQLQVLRRLVADFAEMRESEIA